MKNIVSIFALVILLGLVTGCNYKTDTGTLYYTPNCGTIKGSITLDKNGETMVFTDDLDAEFQQSGIKVRIAYETKEPQVISTPCYVGTVISINHIEKQ